MSADRQAAHRPQVPAELLLRAPDRSSFVGSGFWIIGVGGTVLVLLIVNGTALASMVWGASSAPEE